MLMKVQQFINGIGADPRNEDGTIKGEETDGAIAGVKPGVMDIVGVAGGKPQRANLTCEVA